MNFGFLLGLCLFSFINAKYLLVNVEDEQQVRGPKPPAPVLVTKPPVAPKRPLPTCIQPGGKCLGKTKLTLTFEFSTRSVKDPAECCQGYTCVSGMCLKPRISLDGLGKKVDIDNDPSEQRSLNAEERKNTTSPEDGRARALAPKFYHIEGWKDCTGSKNTGSFIVHCLPLHRPEKCKHDLWIELNDLAKKEPSEAPGPCDEKSSGVLPVILCRKHQETCGLLFGGPGKCCDGLKCERNFKFGLPGTCVKASELVPPSLCKALNDTCGYQATHPPKQHGDCCVGMKCQRTGLGGAGRCVIGKCKNHQEYCGCATTYPPTCHGDCCGTLTCEYHGVGGAGTCVNKGKCKNHGEKCGRQAILGAKDYGKCCEGSICQAEKPGAIMKCVKESQKQSRGQCVPPCSDGDICCTDTHTCASSCS